MHFINKNTPTNVGSSTGPATVSVDIVHDSYSTDAWNRPKSVVDKSLLGGMFTASVPREVWREVVNTVETPDTSPLVNVTSESGKAVVNSGATLNDFTILDTKRSPRYEPNRGHLYSSSIILPNPTAAGTREFGMFTEENGQTMTGGVTYEFGQEI